MSALSAAIDMITGGGLTTAITGGISIWAKLKEKKLDHDQERARWTYEVSAYRYQAKHEQYLAQQNLLIRKEQGAIDLRLSALNSERELSKLKNVSRWVNNWRSLNRILITYALLIAAFWMHYRAGESIGAISELERMLVLFVTNAAASAIGFWFGDRVVKKDWIN